MWAAAFFSSLLSSRRLPGTIVIGAVGGGGDGWWCSLCQSPEWNWCVAHNFLQLTLKSHRLPLSRFRLSGFFCTLPSSGTLTDASALLAIHVHPSDSNAFFCGSLYPIHLCGGLLGASLRIPFRLSIFIVRNHLQPLLHCTAQKYYFRWYRMAAHLPRPTTQFQSGWNIDGKNRNG